MTLILNNDEIASMTSMDSVLAGLEEAYRELAAGRGVTRRRSDTLVPASQQGSLYSLKSMDGIAPHLGVGAVRINSDILTWPRITGQRRRVKVPMAPGKRYTGLILLFSTTTANRSRLFRMASYSGCAWERPTASASNTWHAKTLKPSD